jgi:hypothetical protein
MEGNTSLVFILQPLPMFTFKLHITMTQDKTTPKRVTYLSQVFSDVITDVLIVLFTLVLIYCLSLLLFADWSSYRDPYSAKGQTEMVGGTMFLVLLAMFLVPLLSKEKVAARRTQVAQPDESGFIPGQKVAYLGPLSNGKMITATYLHQHESAGGLAVITIDGVSWETARPEELYQPTISPS